MFVALGDSIVRRDHIASAYVRWWENGQIAVRCFLIGGRTLDVAVSYEEGVTVIKGRTAENWTEEDVAGYITELLNEGV